VHSRQSGVTDHYAQNDIHAMASRAVSSPRLKRPARPNLNMREPRDARVCVRGNLRLVSADGRKPFDVHDIISAAG